QSQSLLRGSIWIPYFFFQAEDGIRDFHVTGVQTCALPIFRGGYLMAGKKNVKNSRYIEADISHFNKEMLTKEYHWLDENIKAERFDPDPEPSKCMFCSVRTACEFSQA